MEILVAILVIALIVAVGYIVMQRRPAAARAAARPRAGGTGRRSRAPRRDPTAVAVVEHAEATDPHEVQDDRTR